LATGGGGARSSRCVAWWRHGEQRQQNAAFEAEGIQLMPLQRRHVLAKAGRAVRRVEGGILKVKWTEEESIGMKKRDKVGPGDVLGTVRGDSWVNKMAIAIIDGASGVDSVGMPFGPPARIEVREIAVRRMASKEMSVVASRDSRIFTTSIRIVCERKIDLNQVPMGLKGVGGSVRHKEESIGRLGDGGVQRIVVEGWKRG